MRRLCPEIISDHLDRWPRRIPVIAEALQADYAPVQKAIDYIRSLEPKPGVSLSTDSPSQFIMPDVTVFKVAGEWVILVNDSYSHRLHLSPSYQAMLQNADSPGTKKFLRDKLNSALWLLKAIEQRRTTLCRITEFILEYPGILFQQGCKAPASHAPAGCGPGFGYPRVYRQSSHQWQVPAEPRGIYAFKYFSRQIWTPSMEWGWPVVKEVLEEVVATEDKGNPLTDQELALILQRRGVKISRRTVAKYREQLGIPSSNLRRRWQ